jgi:hypothetical protein
MSQTPDTAPDAGFDEAGAAFETLRTDAVLTGRAMSSGEYLAGILAAAQLDTAGTPRKLPVDLWPDEDPAVVQEIWDRACVVAWRAAQFALAPWLHRDRLQDLQAALNGAGFAAMGGSLDRSMRLVLPPSEGHPVDGEEARGHDTV